MELLKLDIQRFASIGLKRYRWAKMNDDGKSYGEVKSLVGAIENKVSINLAEAKLYGDDQLKESVEEFVDGNMTMGITEDPDDVFAELLGRTEQEIQEKEGKKEYIAKSTDVAPYVGFGHVVVKMVDNSRKYKVEWFPKVKFKSYVADKTTKNESLTFTTPSVEATVYENEDKEWMKYATFDTETEAEEYLDSLFVQAV